jgi:pimeloyl-ACP methyl ester carboxylesterase
LSAATGVFVSDAARERVLASYATRLRALGGAVSSRTVETSHGRTHLLLAGDWSEDGAEGAGAPALVVVHGANGDAAQMAAAYAFLAERHRCVFVDMPGEPTPSLGERIPRGDDSLARWMAELLDGLGLSRVSLLGMSGGGYVVLRAAMGLGDRVERIVAVVPEGFVEIGEIPDPTPENAGSFVMAITEPGSGFPRAVVEKMAEQTALSFAAVREPMRLGPLFGPEDFAGFEVPVMIIAGGEDAIFDGRELLRRAEVIVPSLVEGSLIPEANHVHLRLFRGPEIDRATAFLARSTA